MILSTRKQEPNNKLGEIGEKIIVKEACPYNELSSNNRKERNPRDSFKWHEIDWQKANEEIATLQEKIVTATLKSKYDEVYKLQRKIVRSFSGRAIAVRKVVTNSVSKTAGVDKIKWRGPQEYWKAIEELGRITSNPRAYTAQPLLRVHIPKGNTGETRPLGIPTLMDRAVQAVYHLAVDPVVETQSDKNSFGFRKHRSTQDAITAIRSLLDKKTHPHWILDADLAKCFYRINHDFLMKRTPICDKTVLEQWLKSGVMEDFKFSQTTEGTPQGGIISPMLCNVALNGIEREVNKANPLRKGISAGVHLIRYADDMIVTGKSGKILVEIKEIMNKFLKERGLEFNENKTKITNIKQGFDFLGFRIERKPLDTRINQKSDQDSVLIIKPSKKGINKLKDTISNRITKETPLEKIIANLNPVLRGWGEHKRISYHPQQTFIKLDHYIWYKMIKWSQRHKGSLRISVNRYRISTKNRKWNWGRSKTEKLLNLGEIPILKLRPLKLDRNPYINEDKEYFIRRKEKRVYAKFRATIYRKFNNTCPSCNESLFNGEHVELHHIKPKKEGGKYRLDNIQPLHQICHQKATHKVSG